jgi:NAD(P)-dependent dehydrogenase (short-subunit alcohol dehydrogenase family)
MIFLNLHTYIYLGLGKATAFNFAKHGISNLALSDFNHDALLAVAEGIKAQYPHVEVETMVVDVTDTKGVNVSVEQTVKRFGRIDIGVNFAGIIGAGTRTTDDDAEADWMRVVDVNLHGVFRCERALLRAMMKQEFVSFVSILKSTYAYAGSRDLGPREGRGNIINMASMFGVVGLPADLEGPSYGAAKHGKFRQPGLSNLLT